VKSPVRSRGAFRLEPAFRVFLSVIAVLLLLVLLLHELEDLHRRVVVVEHIALGGLADVLLECRRDLTTAGLPANMTGSVIQPSC
jgi:hypothetical protein